MTEYLPHLLGRLMNALNLQLLEILRPLNLTVQQYRVMQVLQAAPDGISIGEVSRDMIVEQSAVSRLMDQLQRRGLIRRSRSPRNSKVVEVTLTERGRAILEQISPQVRQIVSNAISVFENDEEETLDLLLGKLLRHVRNSS